MIKPAVFTLLVLLVLCSSEGKGQDLIIRIYGDTIHSKIDQEDGRFIYYRTVKTKRGETEIISRKEVSEIIYGSDLSGVPKIAPKKFEKNFKTFQLMVHAGYSRTLKADDLYGDEFESVYDEMREGAFLDVRANYFLNEGLGLGLLYSRSSYQTNSSVPIVVSLPSGTDLMGELSHDRTLRYYALNLAFRLKQSVNVTVQVDVGLGILTFKDQAEFIGNYSVDSSSLGGHLSATFQLGLGEGFYLPAVISIKGFNISAFDIDASSEMNSELVGGLQGLYEGLEGGITVSRIQLGLGLGFAF